LVSEIVIIIAPITFVVIMAAVYLSIPRPGPHYTSRLTCPKCGKTFDYEWLPGGSFTVIRLGTKRLMCCQICHKWSTFDVISAIVKPVKEEEKSGDTANSSEGT
jgi:hypothetical protein